MRYSLNNQLRYQDACELIKELKQTGIDACITSGGIAIYPEDNRETSLMFEICAKRNVRPHDGATMHQDAIMGGSMARDAIARVVSDNKSSVR